MSTAKRIGSVYTLKMEYEHAMLVEHEVAGNRWEMWHAVISHISHSKFKMTQEATEGLPNVVLTRIRICAEDVYTEKYLSRAFHKSRRQRQHSHCSSFILTSWAL